MNRIGVDLGGTKIEAIALSTDGEELVRLRVATPANDYQAILQAISTLVGEVEAAAAPTFPAIGIGTPGAVSPATGLMKNSNSEALNGRPFPPDLESMLGRPVISRNDADCFALSEARDGAGSGRDTVFGVIIGTGVGGGIVVDGRALSGPNAIAGEWGHNPLPWPRDDERPGVECYCGLRGCIETFLSGPGFAGHHQSRSGRRAAPEIVAAARAGDVSARRSLADYADRLARSLAVVINLLDPDVIVLGGGMSNIDELYRLVPETWGSYVFSDTVRTPLVRNKHGDSSGVRGAAWLVDPVT
ncbi:MAG: ROK family protein [Actinomycetota bacterium]